MQKNNLKVFIGQVHGLLMKSIVLSSPSPKIGQLHL